MKSGYIPNADAQFTEWSEHFVGTVTKEPKTYQLTRGEIESLRNEFEDFDRQYRQAVAARDAAMAAVEAKDERRKELEGLIRATAKRIQADNRVSDAARRDAGLPVHKTNRRPVPAPATAPAGNVSLTARLEQTLTFADSETKRRRPAGAIGVEIYMTIGDAVAPVDPSAYSFVEVCSRSPKVMEFCAKDANKVAHYLLRWVNHKGETGPWSAPRQRNHPRCLTASSPLVNATAIGRHQTRARRPAFFYASVVHPQFPIQTGRPGPLPTDRTSRKSPASAFTIPIAKEQHEPGILSQRRLTRARRCMLQFPQPIDDRVTRTARLLKHQWLYLNQLDSADTVRNLVAFYVDQHNTQLPHSAFHGQTPDEMYFGTGEHIPKQLEAARTAARAARLKTNRERSCHTCDELVSIA